MSPFIIPIFISHKGCPHRCVFCNQESITGQLEGASNTASSKMVEEEIKKWLGRSGVVDRQVQVAFYGGSFTGLPVEQQEELLGAVKPFLADGQVDAIRLSTRPDYIGKQTADFLFAHGVRIVELGIQSLEDDVLQRSRRGHIVADVEKAFVLLKQSSIQIGGQLMTGLPGETVAGLFRGVRKLAALKPDFVRIYPVVVVRGSVLENLYNDGRYVPLSLERAVVRTAKMKEIFDQHGIPVIRMGLQPGEDLAANLVAGPQHPAFGEFVKSRLLYKKVRHSLQKAKGIVGKKLLLAPADQSIFRGQKNYYWNKLTASGLLDGVDIVFDGRVSRGSVNIES